MSREFLNFSVEKEHSGKSKTGEKRNAEISRKIGCILPILSLSLSLSRSFFLFFPLSLFSNLPSILPALRGFFYYSRTSRDSIRAVGSHGARLNDCLFMYSGRRGWPWPEFRAVSGRRPAATPATCPINFKRFPNERKLLITQSARQES